MNKNTGNEPHPNVVINIGTAYNVNPAATKVENTFNIYSQSKGKKVIAEVLGIGNDSSQYHGEPEENIDRTPIRTEILNYVSRVRPLLTDEAKSDYMKVWEDIIDLPEVEVAVYKSGKQKGTNFNRDLVANILYYLRHWKIYREVYKQDYNGAAMTFALEQDKNHSVKHALRDDPPQSIREAIDVMMKHKHECWPH